MFGRPPRSTLFAFAALFLSGVVVVVDSGVVVEVVVEPPAMVVEVVDAAGEDVSVPQAQSDDVCGLVLEDEEVGEVAAGEVVVVDTGDVVAGVVGQPASVVEV